MSQQNASPRELLGDFVKHKRSTIRIRVPRVHKDDGMASGVHSPRRADSSAHHWIFVQVRMELDQRRIVQPCILSQLLQRFSSGIRIHRNIAEKACGNL